MPIGEAQHQKITLVAQLIMFVAVLIYGGYKIAFG
jgi:hypothetical protein